VYIYLGVVLHASCVHIYSNELFALYIYGWIPPGGGPVGFPATCQLWSKLGLRHHLNLHR